MPTHHHHFSNKPLGIYTRKYSTQMDLKTMKITVIVFVYKNIFVDNNLTKNFSPILFYNGNFGSK